jgi:hypothetical protein
MVTSLFDLGTQYILAGFEDEAYPGVILVIPNKNKVDIPRLVAWAIDECALDHPEPEEDLFRAMYVSNQRVLINMVRQWLRRCRRRNNRDPLREQLYEAKGKTLPGLVEANFATVNTLCRVTDRFPTDSLELLVLDERGPNEMARLVPFVQRAKPLFTLVITSHQPGPDWPWSYLGEPYILRGPSATPPAVSKEEPPPDETTA